MAIEIERKFLLRDKRWRAEVQRSTDMRQGYLAGSARCSIRVRVSGSEAHLNIKSATLGITRSEFEYAVPLADAEDMLNTLCGQQLHKTRHYVLHHGHEWEIDEFHGANAGLVVAELELETSDEHFARPDWLGEEVSDDPRYYNSRLVEQPYSTWPEAPNS